MHHSTRDPNSRRPSRPPRPGARALFAATLCLATFSANPAAAEGPQVSALNPNAPAPVGLISPSFDGDWRFRVAIDGWAPNVIEIATRAAGVKSVLDKDLGWLLKNMDYYIPVDLEVRKGSFGAFFHSLFLGLSGTTEIIGPVELDWDEGLYLFDIGLSYELGRWRLREGSFAPELTLEPFLEARVLHQPIDISILGFKQSGDLSTAAPVLGLRTFIDLTEHWNLTFEGDYGGFGVDDDHQTWQAVGLAGYRWKGWGVHWNLQAGYRAMRIFDIRRRADVAMDARGADVVLSVEF